MEIDWEGKSLDYAKNGWAFVPCQMHCLMCALCLSICICVVLHLPFFSRGDCQIQIRESVESWDKRATVQIHEKSFFYFWVVVDIERPQNKTELYCVMLLVESILGRSLVWQLFLNKQCMPVAQFSRFHRKTFSPLLRLVCVWVSIDLFAFAVDVLWSEFMCVKYNAWHGVMCP